VAYRRTAESLQPSAVALETPGEPNQVRNVTYDVIGIAESGEALRVILAPTTSW
jgi:hypothetical protein